MYSSNVSQRYLQQYRQAGQEALVESADPHQLVDMMFGEILDRIAVAKCCMASNVIAEKGEKIGTAIRIIDGLKACLDGERGGEIASNLYMLYDYMQKRLLLANLKNDAEMLDEVTGLLREIRSAWSAIPHECRQPNPA